MWFTFIQEPVASWSALWAVLSVFLVLVISSTNINQIVKTNKSTWVKGVNCSITQMSRTSYVHLVILYIPLELILHIKMVKSKNLIVNYLTIYEIFYLDPTWISYFFHMPCTMLYNFPITLHNPIQLLLQLIKLHPSEINSTTLGPLDVVSMNKPPERENPSLNTMSPKEHYLDIIHIPPKTCSTMIAIPIE